MRVRGVIVTDVGEIPLPGALLYADGLFGKRLLGKTDSNGEFQISAPDLKAFQVIIEKPGFQSLRRDPGEIDEQVTQMQNGGTVEALPDWARITFIGIGVYLLTKLL